MSLTMMEFENPMVRLEDEAHVDRREEKRGEEERNLEDTFRHSFERTRSLS